MLEVRNVTKIYKPKKGVPVKALDDVSVKFADSGMVFILGKSGSGKSTLLNTIGGLDSFDSGEIVIKGKSSKNFSQSDFDSYRNTYIGFIFQEYNILNEFNIEKNIAIALELQGKKITHHTVNKYLEQVDLAGYNKRKVDELSGGQKQRVAIARALIKDPEIIIADEPTGALDSTTGEQVMVTLQNLSKNHLVIVVTHDREFAEKYGDRIIQLKDGKILTDETRRKTPAQSTSQGFQIIDEKTIRIEPKHKLSNEEIVKIIDTIDFTKNEVIISADDKRNEKFREVVKIDDEGNSEHFGSTNAKDLISKKNSGAKFIKSKLKFRDGFKMGAKSLRLKPFKLIFTMLLCLISFTMFGMVSTFATFNPVTNSVKSLKESHVNYVSFSNTTKHDYGNNDFYFEKVAFDDASAKILESEYKGINFQKVYGSQYSYLYINNMQSVGHNDYYHSSWAVGLTTINSQTIENLGYNIIAGDFPKTANQVMLPKLILESYQTKGYVNPDNTTIKNISAEEIIGKTLDLGSYSYEICGVVDTMLDSTKYESLKDLRNQGISTYVLQEEFGLLKEYSFHNVLFVNEEAISSLNTNQKDIMYMIGAMPTNTAEIKSLFTKYYADQKDLSKNNQFIMNNIVTNALDTFGSIISSMQSVFLYIALGLCVFAALMLMNYISNSVAAKKREIGILRAVGATSKDVYSIFLYESLIIAFINTILSCVATFVMVVVLNGVFAKQFLLSITLLNFSWIQLLLLFGVSVVVAVVSSLIPSLRISKKKPIDAINNR